MTVETPLSSLRLAWLLMSTSLLAFVLLAMAVSHDLTSAVDGEILMWFRDASGVMSLPIWFKETLVDITALGGYPVIVLAMLAGISGLCRMRQIRAALFLGLTVAGATALSSVLKLLFDRPRPDLVIHLDQTYTSSFPSAHAMVSLVAWLTLALVMTRFIESARLCRFLLGFAALLSLLVGFSRVFLGVHWPSDVLAGWLVGITWVGGCWLYAFYSSQEWLRVGQPGRST